LDPRRLGGWTLSRLELNRRGIRAQAKVSPGRRQKRQPSSGEHSTAAGVRPTRIALFTFVARPFGTPHLYSLHAQALNWYTIVALRPRR
ncbi:MAG: hypothetical protein ABI901_07385, partial [Roseiflexaceae bacterium]